MTSKQESIEQMRAERDAALAHFQILTTEIARLERQLTAEQDHDELLIRAHERLLQLRPGWPEADHGDGPAHEPDRGYTVGVPCGHCAAAFERLRTALEILSKARWRGGQQATMQEVNRIASEALRGAAETISEQK